MLPHSNPYLQYLYTKLVAATACTFHIDMKSTLSPFIFRLVSREYTVFVLTVLSPCTQTHIQ